MSDFESVSKQGEGELPGVPFSNDLDWMAFCYVADELSGPQLAEFETRLENEQAAREAVAEAMKLSTAVFECPASSAVPTVTTKPAKVAQAAHDSSSPSSPSSSKTVRSSRMRVLFGLAAALVLCLGLAAWIVNSSQPAADVVVQVPDEQLAIVWADVIQTEVELLESLEIEEEFQFASSESGDEDDWMYIGITELNKDTNRQVIQ